MFKGQIGIFYKEVVVFVNDWWSSLDTSSALNNFWYTGVQALLKEKKNQIKNTVCILYIVPENCVTYPNYFNT